MCAHVWVGRCMWASGPESTPGLPEEQVHQLALPVGEGADKGLQSPPSPTARDPVR